MLDIKVLDCTLREGGYVNNWLFGNDNIQEIIKNLNDAGIDIIECGYLNQSEYNNDKTIFNNLNDLKSMFPHNCREFALMINYGEFDIDKLPNADNIILRVAFKKHQCNDALNYCKTLKEKGYKIFINPMNTGTYSQDELIKIIQKVNKICPYGFTVTDSTGSMKENDLAKILNLINKNLDKNICLCFHSHNNLQLSFSNSQFLLKNCEDRTIILDSTLSGIGRGAGNLCTEVITRYLNDNYKKNYNCNLILKLIEKQISPIFEKTSWGYSIPYYLSGLHNCHPYYAKFLMNQNLPYEKINEILQNIPADQKSCYDEKLIKNLL